MQEEIDPSIQKQKQNLIEEVLIDKFVQAGERSTEGFIEFSPEEGVEGLRVTLGEAAGGRIYLDVLKNNETGEEYMDITTDPNSAKRHFRFVEGELFELFDDSRGFKKKDSLFQKMLIGRIRVTKIL